MANLFQRMFNPAYVTSLEESAAQVPTLSAKLDAYELDQMRLTESLTDLMKFVEDVGWERIDGWEEDKGLSVEALKKYADMLSAYLTINPTIKKAINSRVGYIWGRGVSFEGGGKAFVDNAWNKSQIFNDAAHWRLEAQLATVGNVWAVRSAQNEVTLVPLDQIRGWVTDPDNPTRVLYWLRSYTTTQKTFNNGTEETKTVESFIPAHDMTRTPAPSIDGIKVDRSAKMIHLAANRQEGWILGVPDILAVVFWTKAHKELFEAGATYVKAQGKFASKVVAKTQMGAQNAAARVADSARRDPMTGEVLDYGGTAAMSGGLDYQLMGKMSGGVDFDAFDPVAGMIAAGLGIPVRVLLASSTDEMVSLEQSTVDEMVMRQALWSLFFEGIFPGKVKVIWPKIKTEPEYRRLQAVEIANKTNVLHREELRMLTLEGFGIIGDPKDLPDVEEQPEIQKSLIVGEKQAEWAADAAEQAAQATTPEQGVDAGVGKLSNGSDQNADRDNKADRNVTR